MIDTLHISSSSMYSHDPANNCMRISHSNGKTYLFDYADFCKILNYEKSFLFREVDSDYPSFLSNDKYTTYLEFLYKDGNIYNYEFLNGNNQDLRRTNVGIAHHLNSYAHENYNVLEFIPGHYPKNKHAGVMKNPLWRISVDQKEKLLVHCEPGNTFFILCDKSYQKILDYEKNQNSGKKLTFYKCPNGYIQTHIATGTLLYVHQIIMDWYGHGQGTKNTSIDHIDRNPLNNTFENLRIANREEQEQNSKGIMPNTKRERQVGARELPEGIDQTMLRKYVVYYYNIYNKEKNKSREYFRVEDPRLDTPWESSKSEKVSILEKLEKANRVAEDLDRGIFPIKETPQYPTGFSLIKKPNGKSCLIFDKRGVNGNRYTMRTTLGEDAYIAEEIDKMRQQLVDKYGPEIA